MKKIHFYPILKYCQILYFKHMNAIFALAPAPSRIKEENMGREDTSVPDLPSRGTVTIFFAINKCVFQ